ncbi:hypothetical protein OAG11_03900 [Verrucomicrobia bacterium]|nr:hypothetical protein [Verrucomicrobiota bacterium]
MKKLSTMIIHEGNKLALKQKICLNEIYTLTSKLVNETIRQTRSYTVLSIINNDFITEAMQRPNVPVF